MTQTRQSLIVAVLCLIAVVFQARVAHAVAVHSAQPDLPLVVLACGAALVGGVSATTLGLMTGYLTATLTPMIDFGSHLASRTIAGALAGSLARHVIMDSVWTPPIIVTLSTLAAELTFALMVPGVWLHHLRHYLPVFAGEVLYNAVLSYPVYFIMRKIGIGFRPENPFAPPR